jgi:hypothetical protein
MDVFKRTVRNIDHPEAQQGMTPQHRVRPLLPAAMRGDWAATDPFLALMEDWFPRGVQASSSGHRNRHLCSRRPDRPL